jgi:hypothetical protein
MTILERWENGIISTQEALRLIAQERTDLAEEYAHVRAAYRAYEQADTDFYEIAKRLVMREGRSFSIGTADIAYIDPDPKDAADVQTVYDVISLLERRGIPDLADHLRSSIHQERKKPHVRWTNKKEKHI